ncbi:hypothetical protein AGOR_G00097580 [Albula goreensis]|uniref:Uncharacterized protein n=1 Tax=Albula goreensis TaxID=1534307 RepID=A0A8T3DMX8_9TELE|nr:hypothetical protein AGOR_G00097580 [Albula goreensis]
MICQQDCSVSKTSVPQKARANGVECSDEMDWECGMNDRACSGGFGINQEPMDWECSRDDKATSWVQVPIQPMDWECIDDKTSFGTEGLTEEMDWQECEGDDTSEEKAVLKCKSLYRIQMTSKALNACRTITLREMEIEWRSD